MVLPCRICMHEASNHTHPVPGLSPGRSLYGLSSYQQQQTNCPIHGSLSTPALLPAGDLAAAVVLARRSIRRSISHCCLSGTVLCALHACVCQATLTWLLTAQQSQILDYLHVSRCIRSDRADVPSVVICESGSEYVYMGMYGCCILSPGSTTGKGNRLLVKGPV